MEKSDLLAHLKKQGYPDKVIAAFAAVEREKFVPEHLLNYSYEDIPLPLADGSTLSQPSTIAFMIELLELEKGNTILEIGAGSGYVLALLSSLLPSSTVYGVELNKSIAVKAKERLTDYSNIHIIIRNGFYGLQEKSPFDRILASAAFHDKPIHLLDQLADPGILVAPVKDTIHQFRKLNGEITEQIFYGFSFVTMIDGEKEAT